ncbi:ImmA/IrrE family metallo-endopeptidase [uncultured Microbacterium sp.]|uniref:ImmA/IrrE family metallo-endopeptidase n=1 Tax=uncultured Microbacterium sp. TaxID=191216 RepID=UPI00345A0DE4
MTQSTKRTNRTHPKGRAYDPWEHADDLGVRVFTQRLRTAHGLWLPDQNAILVHSQLRVAHQRTVLAHELGHAVHAHSDDRPKHERQADRFAAHNLICPTELEELYEWCPDEGRLVDELGVTTRLFQAYVLSAV